MRNLWLVLCAVMLVGMGLSGGEIEINGTPPDEVVIDPEETEPPDEVVIDGEETDQGTEYEIDFMLDFSRFLLGDITDCETGEIIPPSAIYTEFFFREGTQAPYSLADLERVNVRAPDYEPYVITRFSSFTISLLFIRISFLVPAEREICLIRSEPEPDTDCLDCAWEEDLMGPYHGTTDQQGHFTIEIRDPFPLDVSGQLIGPERDPVPNLSFYLYLEPRCGLPTAHSFMDVASLRFVATGFDMAYVGLHVEDLTLVGLWPTLNIGRPIFLNAAGTGCRVWTHVGECEPGTVEFRITNESVGRIQFQMRRCNPTRIWGRVTTVEHSRRSPDTDYRLLEERKGNVLEYSLHRRGDPNKGEQADAWYEVEGAEGLPVRLEVPVYSGPGELLKDDEGNCTPTCSYAVVEHTEERRLTRPPQSRTVRTWYKCADDGRWVQTGVGFPTPWRVEEADQD